MSEEKLNVQEIVKLSAETGANAAMETLNRERARERKELADSRLRNTKLLLRNYRVFCAHAENAVYDVEECESAKEIIADLMMPGQDSPLIVESIKKSVARTATIVKHMQTMMQLYQAYCHVNGTSEDERRTVSELAKEEGVVERTIYKDIDIACERIAALMFGIDGLKSKRK